MNIVEDYVLYSNEYANQIDDLQTLEKEYKQIASDYDVYSNEYMKIAYYLGLSHIYYDDAGKSVPLLNQVLNGLSNENHKDSKIRTQFALGNAYSLLNEYEKSIKHYNDALDNIEPKKNQDLYFEIIENFEIILSRVGLHKRAQKILMNATEGQGFKDGGKRYLSFVQKIAENYYSIGELDSSIYFFNKVLAHKEQLGNVERISLFSTIGNLYNQKGDYSNAQQYLMEALNLSETVLDSFFIMSLCSDVALIYKEQEQFDKAIHYSAIAINIASLKDIPFIQANNLKTQGYLYYKKDSLNKALYSYQEALKLYRRLNQPVNIASTQIEIASIFRDRENYLDAKMYLEEAIKVRDYTLDPIGVVQSKLLLAEVEIGLGDYENAIAGLKQCITESTRMNNLNFLSQSHELLVKAYEKNKFYAEALKHSKHYHQLQDSLISIERTKVINEIEAEYALDKELLEQEKQLIKQQDKIEHRNYQVITLTALLILFLLLSILFMRLFIKNKQLNKQRLESINKQQELQRMRAVMEGEEKERKRISRELHDDLGAQLAGIKVHVNALQNDIPDITKLSKFSTAENLIDNACQSVREISHNMTPSALDDKSISVLLEDLANKFYANYGIAVDYQSDNIPDNISKESSITLYRITQELLRNIEKHSQATEVILQIAYEQNNIHLIVEDNGIGFDVDNLTIKKGIGLDNIRSRVEYLEGHMDIHTDKNLGSTFTIDIPI